MLIWKNSAYYNNPSQLGESFDQLLNNLRERRQESTVVRTDLKGGADMMTATADWGHCK